MLIRKADVWQRGLADVRIASGRIKAVGQLEPLTGEAVIDAQGGALLPGLHDHHIHLAALAARAESLICGPPEVTSAQQLKQRLQVPGTGWLRGILYHESVMGLPDAAALDRLQRERPLRIQHRSGRMWLFNSAALEVLLAKAAPPPGLERENGRFTGRLFDEDAWLRGALGSTPPDLADVSTRLAKFGVTGITDMSPRNDRAMAGFFNGQRQSGRLRQRCMLAGKLDLAQAEPSSLWALGPAKLHLHENALPDFDETVEFIAASHRSGRALASHCTTETELVFTLAALEAAGVRKGDRVEHAGIANEEHIAEIARLGLHVVSQPHFVSERGDHYLADVEARLHPALYRLGAFVRAGVPLAAGSDAPFGSADPWTAMAAAVSRRTPTGAIVGKNEGLDPEAALSLFLADPADLTRQRAITLGDEADLVLLDRAWAAARERLTSDDVRSVFISGEIVHDSIDQPPIKRTAR